MERGLSNISQSRVTNQPQKSRKSTSATPAGTHTSNIPQPTNMATGSERRMSILLFIFIFIFF